MNYFEYGGEEYHCASARNITDRKKIEEQSRRNWDELAHVSRLNAMGEMATGLAHEINQPLTAIANYADAAEQAQMAGKSPTSESICELLSRISEQAFRAGEIIRRLRRLVEKSHPHRSPLDVNDVIREVVGLVEADARLNNVRIILNLRTPIPPVLADRIQVQQILLNLFRNALDAFTDHATTAGEVTMETSVQNDAFIQIVVKDNGPGLPSGNIESIFDAFNTTKSKGLGMGLPISRSIVEAHGGRLSAEPNRSGGAAFRVTLPVSDEAIGMTE